jgi:hypothetical protein
MSKAPLIERIETAMWDWPVIGLAIQRRRSRQHARAFMEAGMDVGELVPTDPAIIRRATDHQLHAMLAGDHATKAERIGLEREQRRREAWAAPAGRAYWISWGGIGRIGVLTGLCDAALTPALQRRKALPFLQRLFQAIDGVPHPLEL